jgi:hypothetical protein
VVPMPPTPTPDASAAINARRALVN